jgi:flavodoxin
MKDMKIRLITLLAVLLCCMTASAQTDSVKEQSGKKILIAYFSWGGNTQHVAEHIASLTGGTLFRIEPEKPYPTEYKPCTEVAKEEKESDARPAIKNKIGNWDEYDTIFIGCPVWWWTAPMIINTFTENYDFKGKTVVPFCTYASTYRDETLARIVELTSAAEHLKGFGAVDKKTKGIEEWLKNIGITE